MTQWFLMAALLIAVATIATRPWWRGVDLRLLRRRSANVAAYRSRAEELKQEQAAGLVPAGEAQAMERELAARLVAEAQGEEAAPPAPAARRPLLALALTVLLAVFAAGWYGLGGTWVVQQQIDSGQSQDRQVAGMVQKLAERLRQQPDDPAGWAMLGRSYFVMQKFAEAAQAYGEANSRATAPNPDWLSGQGEALAFARDRDLQGTPAQLFERALTVDPSFGKALWYAGLAAMQAGDSARARQHWEKLAADPELPAEMREVLQAHLQQLGAAQPQAAQAAASPAPPAAEAAAAGAGLNLHVSLAPDLAARVPADAVLFVFAKAEAGPPMPLAVQRLPGAKLPLDVRLDDSMAMAPAMRLSQFDKYAITARLSRSGGAQAQSGDLEGSLHADKSQAGQPLQLLIDRVVP